MPSPPNSRRSRRPATCRRCNQDRNTRSRGTPCSRRPRRTPRPRSASRPWRSASMRLASRRPHCPKPPGRAWPASWLRAVTATWVGWPTSADAARPIRRRSGRRPAASSCWRLNYAPGGRPPGPAAASGSRQPLGLCPGPRLPRRSQASAQGPGPLDGRDLGLRGQGLRRHRAGDGEAPGRPGRGRLAGQAQQPGVPRLRLLAVPGRGLHDASSWRPIGPRPTTAAPAGAAWTPARPTPSRRPTAWTPGAASPT